MYSYFIVFFPVTNMDPVLWTSSNPALQLGMKYEESLNFPGQHVFGTTAEPATVVTLLRQDQRVGWAELIKQEEWHDTTKQFETPPVQRECPYGWRSPTECYDITDTDRPGYPVPETRPEPGTPEMKLPGYIPKMPGSNGGKLSWDEKVAAGLGPAIQEIKAEARQKVSIPWWLLLLGAWAISRR